MKRRQERIRFVGRLNTLIQRGVVQLLFGSDLKPTRKQVVEGALFRLVFKNRYEVGIAHPVEILARRDSLAEMWFLQMDARNPAVALP